MSIERPRAEAVTGILLNLGHDPKACVLAGRQYVDGWDAGRRAGHEEAQRYLRLLLGVELPTLQEAAYWNAPFPLAKEST